MMSGNYSMRRASHAGSWYAKSAKTLEKQLCSWMEKATNEQNSAGGAQAIIAPHAGYSYSGPIAAFAYSNVRAENVERVFLLGPSHHYYLENCALSNAEEYETPLGNITIDKQICQKLKETRLFSTMTKSQDEEEHSLELHLPYIVHSLKGKEYKLVPVLVGNLTPESEKRFGSIFAEYLADEKNLFVISSDFCHWGSRFNFMHYNKEDGEIFESIEKLDKMGMELIEKLDFDGFIKYLREYGNTICGRHPIAVLLASIKACPSEFSVKFVKYAQSSQCRSRKDSSVSYASAIAITKK
mmetsp:Transcript_7950/g.10383  ORF Transcript_7950/g.10383 Transcript_7950/m.10383 type:complete len:298 (+) Transcript_7950:67-960(+)